MEARRARLRAKRLEMIMGRQPNPGRKYMYFAEDTGTIDEANPDTSPSAGMNDMLIKNRDGGSEKGKSAVVKYDCPVSSLRTKRGVMYCEEAIHPGTSSVVAPLLSKITLTYNTYPAYGFILEWGNTIIIDTPFEMSDITWNNRYDFGSGGGSGLSPYEYEELVINASKRIVMVMEGFW